MSNSIEDEFKSLGVKIGNEIEVKIIGNKILKVRIIITQEIFETGYFPFINSVGGDIEYWHVDHIDKLSIVIIKHSV